MIGIPVALLAANATEWLVHKYVLHGAGKKKDSFFSFHWHEHHREARRHGMRDSHYERPVWGRHSQGKEAGLLLATGLAVAPLFPVAPFFVGTTWYCVWNYYRVHKRSHEDPKWARENLTWHYDHHMGPKQDANWCVTKPWMDELMGTRVPYAFTERERRDIERRERRRRLKEAKVVATPERPSAPPPPSKKAA